MDPPKRHYKAILPANASPPSTLSLPPPSSSADLVPRARKSPLPTLKGTSSNDRVSDFVRNLVLYAVLSNSIPRFEMCIESSRNRLSKTSFHGVNRVTVSLSRGRMSSRKQCYPESTSIKTSRRLSVNSINTTSTKSKQLKKR